MLKLEWFFISYKKRNERFLIKRKYHHNYECIFLLLIQIHVVDEKRLYQKWAQEHITNNESIDLSFGINAGRQALNNLHYEMAKEGYKEVCVFVTFESKIVLTTKMVPVR